MENQKVTIHSLEKKLVGMLDNMKNLERFADKVEMQAIEMKNEHENKKAYIKSINEGFRGNRNDLQIIERVLYDKEVKQYVTQLENTLEIVMNNYRKTVQGAIESTKHEYDKLVEIGVNCSSAEIIKKQQENINALVAMMTEFLKDGREQTDALIEENAYLRQQNKTLSQIIAAHELTYKAKEPNNNDL